MEKYSCISSFQICVVFNSFFSLTSLCRASSMMLKMWGKKGNPSHAPPLRGKASSFLLLSMVFAVGFFFLYVLYQVEEGSLYS